MLPRSPHGVKPLKVIRDEMFSATSDAPEVPEALPAA
jgi:hypothetical protein